MSSSAPLSVDGITVVRGTRTTIDHVSLELAAGEILAVIGPNGAGKTTLLEAILGLIPVGAGRVRSGGRELRTLGDRGRVFSFMPDDAVPPAEVRISTLLAHARRFGSGTEAEAAELELKLGLRPLLAARAGELSRGERRRVALFTALCGARPVTVLDEPLGAFDPLQLLDVLEVLRAHRDRGRSLLVSVHQLSDAEKIADRVLILDGGCAIACGTLDELRAEAGEAQAQLESIFLARLKRERAHARS